MNSQFRIVFFGTPNFAVESLHQLLKAGFVVAAVVTAPDRPAGRGLKQQFSPVKQFALDHNLEILQPEKLKNEEFLQKLKSINADLFVVVAFRMLPEVVWNMPPLGSYNLHASLLPAYRGAAPINWAIINGEQQTGLTTFKLTHAIDMGDLLLQTKVAIPNYMNAGQLHDLLMIKGAQLLVETLNKLKSDNIKTIPQPQMGHWPHAPKIFKEHCVIPWNCEAKTVHNHIRGLSPHPGAFTFIDNKILKIFSSQIFEQKAYKEPGTLKISNNQMWIATADYWIEILELQLEGKKRMETASLLRGFRFDELTICRNQ